MRCVEKEIIAGDMIHIPLSSDIMNELISEDQPLQRGTREWEW
jgi:hypothetical protein